MVGDVWTGLHELCDGEGTGEMGITVGSASERSCMTGTTEGMEGPGGAGATWSRGVTFSNDDRDSCSSYKCLVRVHKTETLTLALQLSENSMISRNSLLWL